MRLRRALAALGVAFAWAFAAQAYDYNGVTVTAESGSIQKIGDELLVTFNQVGTSKLTLDGYALARVMVVGGGGSGSTGRKATSGTGLDYRGNGGSGGEAIEYDNHYLAAGAYEVAVGAGGAAIEAANNGARTAGKSGGQSSFASIVAKGGAGGVKENGSQNGTGNNTVMGWGSNLKTDISGETLTYSEGGAASTNATKAGAKGADRGCGGGGGGRTNYKSGAGGNGIVIVRIKAASANPPATASFDQFVQYVEGVAVSPFDSIPPWAATITGTTNSTQRGHFSFTVSLKDGYVWSDTFGREDRTFKWAVVDDPAKGDTYLDVTKTVRADSSNPSNATISIIGHVPSEKVAVNVLFMGTMCYAHSLKPKTIQAAINTIAKRASVDWYLFHSKDVLKAKTGKLRDYATDVCSQIADTMIHTNLSGSVAKDGEIDDNFVRNELDRQMQSNNHQALNSFMELLYEVSQDPVRSKKYDYIVLEFDGSRVADGYTAYEHEAEVAAFLKAKYDKGQVIWLVDNCAAGDAEPFGPETKTKRNGEYYYCPCSYFNNGASTVLDTDALYAGLVALTDPDKYLSTVTKSREKLNRKTVSWKQSYRKSSSTDSNVETATKTIYVNQRCASQVPYDNANTLSKYLIKAIQEKPYDLEFIDKIVDSGLEITAAHMSTSNVERAAADLNWLGVTDPSVVSIDINQAAHKVNAVVSNMCSEVWAKLDIDVRDTGSFRTGEDPVTDEDLGRLVATKDPNDGNGSVFKYDPGDDEPTAQGESPTLEPWKYNVYVVTGLVVNGTLKIDGIETNEAFKAKGYDCSVTYRGDPGYALDSITVDGTPLTADEIDEHLSDYGFTNIKADHEVVVVYTNFVVTSEPYTNYYDGAEHTIDVQLPDYHDDITDVKVQYSTDGETYVDTKPVYSNVEHTVVYYKVVGHQAGYGDEEITLAAGSDTVDILPREVNVTAKSARKFYDGEELTAGYEVQHEYSDDLRAEGWGFVGTDDITTVKMTGESVIGADAAKTEKQTAQNVVDQSKTRFTSDEIAGNYIVHYTDGELEVIPVAVKPVVKVYDGAPTNVEVTVTDPPAGTTIRYSYAEDGGYAEAGELTFTGPTNAWESAAEIWVEVSAPGYGTVTNRASATILPRVVVEQAGSDTKAYDGERLVCSNATERADLEAAKAAEVYEARGYTADFPEIDPADAAGFAEGEGFVAAADGNTYLRMTDDSWRLDVGEADNVIVATGAAIASELDDGTSCGNYLFFFEDGLLEVTPAAFTASAEPVEKFYDSTPTNIIVTVAGIPTGVTPTYEYSYSETEGFVPASEFTGPTNVSETAEVWCRVSIPGTTNVVSAVATIKPRIVVHHARNGEWTFNGEEHAQPESFEDTAAEAERSKERWGTDEVLPGSTGFVSGEGYASDLVMTDASKITDPGTVPNVIDQAADKTALAANTKAENYELHYLDGTLTVTPAAFTASAEPVEKFYDSTPTNIIVTVAGIPSGVTPTYEYSYSETEGFVPVSEFTGPTNVSETAEVWCRVIIPGTTNVVSAVVTIKPRIVVSHAKDGEWTFDGEEHAQPDYFEDADAEAERSKERWGTDEVLPGSTGFVSGEGYASDLVMTDASKITDPGTVPNVIDTAADKTALKPNTKAENYELYYLDGTLTVTPAAFTASAEPVEKFYDSVPTNIIVTVAGIPSGVTPTYEYSYSETEGFVPASEFTGPTNVSESATVYCRVSIPGTTNVVSAVATIRPRIVVSHAKDGEWTFNGEEHAQPESFEDADDEAERSKAKWGTDEVLPGSTGFVEGEGYADDLVMTEASRITLPGTKPNVIDQAADKTALAANTKAENYELYYLDGTLAVTPATFTASAEPVEKFYDSTPTNIIVTVSGIPTGVTPTYEYSYSETEGYVPAADFTGPTNVSESAEVYCRVIIPGTTNVVSAMATIRPRIVVSHAKDGEWTFNGEEHAQPESFEDESEEAKLSKAKWGTDEVLPGSTGFVEGEGYADDLVMTEASRITDPGTKPNVIDRAADKTALAASTKPENYELYYLDGTLTVTPATFTASAEPVEKFYDSTPTNIIVTVSGIPTGVTPTYEYSYSETEGFVPASDFTGPTNVSESAEVYCRVIIPGTTNVVSAMATIRPRIVVSHAKDGEWTFNGEEHAQPEYYEDADDEAERSKAKWGTDEVLPGSTGFVEGEGYADDLVMTEASRITDPGTKPNVIDQAADKTALAANTKPENYELYYLDGTLTVTPATFTASAEPVEKFYDSTPTNIIVTVSGIPTGVTPTYEYSYSETEGFVPASDFTGPTNVSETAEVWCRVSIPGTTNVVSAVATIKPRIVVHHARNGEWTFNGEEHAQPESFEDTAAEAERSKERWGTDEVLPGSTGFVDGEGYADDLVMTDESRITLPGTKPNVIDQAADKTALAANTKPENYELHYLDGTLTVTPATFTASAEPVEKFYDSTPTNIIVTVSGIPTGVTPTYEYSYSETEGYVPAADFTGPTNVSESAEVWCRVSIPGTTNVVSAMATIRPRIVVSHAKDGEWTFNGEEHAQPEYFEDESEEAKLSKAKWGTDEVLPGSTGFVEGEGYADDLVMTDESRITLPGTKPNVIDQAADKTALAANTRAENYELHYLDGTLTVTPAVFTASATPYDEFYDGQEHTIEVEVQKPEDAGEATITYSYAEGGTYLPIEDFELLKDVTAGGSVTVYAKVEIEGYATVIVNATVNIKPRIVVEQAESASKTFDGTPLVQPNHHEETGVEAEKSKAKWGTVEAPANSTGFVAGEGFATVPMTADSEQTEPGTHTNLIDEGAVTLLEGTKPDNYIFFYLPGKLAVIQRQEEVRRDPNIPEESKEAVEESDKKIEKTLDEMAKADQEASDVPYVKYQLTVTPTNNLSEATRTTPEKAAEDAKNQIELAESKTGSKIDKVEFVDIVLERTYSKEEAEATASGDYNKDNWEPLDKAEEHGNTLFEVVIPVEVPEGMELIGVTRSCVKGGEPKDEILKPKDPNDPGAEGFVYDPATKTVTLYAKDFCVFGFMMQKTSQGGGGGCSLPGECEEVCLPPVWDFQMVLRADTLCQGVGYVKVSHCGIDREVCGCYRELQTINYSGVWYGCSCGCQLQEDGINVIMADMTRKIKYADGWFEPVSSVDFSGGDLYRFGAYASKVAARFALRFGDCSELQFVGFGNYPLDMPYLQSISGRITGVIDASKSCNGNGHCGIYPLCGPGVNAADPTTWPADETLPGAETAVAFGLFQVRFNASASARLGASRDKGTGKFDIMKIVPSWFAK